MTIDQLPQLKRVFYLKGYEKPVCDGCKGRGEIYFVDFTQQLVVVSMSMRIATCKCKRCKYEWVPRTTKVPRQCPKCWATDWNQPRGKAK